MLFLVNMILTDFLGFFPNRHFGGDVATREHHVNFKHDLFDKLTLVGQVDKKFIAMSMNKNLDSSADNPDKELLLLFDQHAVHERVRIEQLLEGE